MTTDAVGGVWTYALDLARGLAPQAWRRCWRCWGRRPKAEQYAAAAAIPGCGCCVRPCRSNGWRIPRRRSRCGSGTGGDWPRDRRGYGAPQHAGAGRRRAFAGPWSSPAIPVVATWWRDVRGGPMPADFRGVRSCRSGPMGGGSVVAPTAGFAAATAREPMACRAAAAGRPQRRRRACPRCRDPGRRWSFTAGRLWDEAKDMWTLDAGRRCCDAGALRPGRSQGPNGAEVELRHCGCRSASAGTRQFCRAADLRLAARYEPFGLAVLEAAQAGCALVLADTAGFRELWHGAAHLRPRR